MTQTSSFPKNRERGMIGFAVLLLAGVVIMIFTASFFVSWTNYQTGLAFDSYHSQLVEMAGLQQVVEESILDLRSTEPAYNPNSINNDISPEISNRLKALVFTPHVAISLTEGTTPPAHIFYPFGPAATASTLPMFSSAPMPPGIAGTGNRVLRFLTSGPAADLGTATYAFTRSVTVSHNPTGETRRIAVTARLFSVPVTNIDCIAYGLPSTGSVAPSAPIMPNGFFASGVSRLVATLNDPAKDPTFYPDMYDSNRPNSLGYQYENNVLFSWDAYEFIWGSTYQNALLSAAGPTGTFDFDASVNPSIAGVTNSRNSMTIDLSIVTATTLAVVDASGTGRSIQVLGSPAGNSLNAQPLLLYLKNTGSGPTSVNISGDNNRPILLLSRQCALTFLLNPDRSPPQFQGAIILDRNSTASGAVTLFGHLSFYYAANPFTANPAWINMTLNDSPSVKAAVAPLAPRVLLVSTSATNEI
ncbi:MAG TPA: hypothetical protein VNW30_08405 [Opitutaceae bacterium]|jgi:hypothetical protein|nr:hypothetical protein [Opitutaceae bacterium]